MQASRVIQSIKSVFLSNRDKVGIIRLGVFRGILTLSAPRDSLQIRAGLWERETYKYIRRAVSAARWVIDIGAGSGELSIFFASKTKASPVIAVEPWDATKLRQNIVLNGSDRILIVEQYLGTGDDQLLLDSLEVPHQRQGFIKVDADFAELNVLQSGEHLLAESKPLLLVETHSMSLERDCCRYLQSLGYDITIVPNAWWRLLIPEQRPLAHNRWLWAQPT